MGKYRRDYQTDIVIVGWDKCETTSRCLHSVYHHTPPELYQITYVDNGSKRDHADAFIRDPFPEIQYVQLPFNTGFVHGANVGMALSLLSESDYVLLLNNDTRIPEGDDTWLQRLIAPMLEDSQIGAVGAVSDRVYGCQKRKERGEGFAYAPVLIGFCLLLRKAAIRKVGLLDEQFTPGNYEDYDYCIRLEKAGWKLAVAEDVWIHHEQHTSFRELNQTDKFSDLLDGNRAKLKAKWTPKELEKVGVHELGASVRDTKTDSDARLHRR